MPDLPSDSTDASRRRFLTTTAAATGAVWTAPSVVTTARALAAASDVATSPTATPPCQDGNPPYRLTFRYEPVTCTSDKIQDGKGECTDHNGGPDPFATAYIVVQENSSTVYFAGNVSPGGLFEAASETADPIDPKPLHKDLEVLIYNPGPSGNVLVQELKIKTDCSGPLNLEEPYGSLVIVDSKDHTHVCAAKVFALDLQYTGENCPGVPNHSQDPSKTTCTDLNGGPAGAGGVDIEVASTDGFGSDTFATATGVSVGQVFGASHTDGSAFGSATHVRISQGGTVLQVIEFHTSCSQPLAIGDEFGAIRIDHLTSRE